MWRVLTTASLVLIITVDMETQENARTTTSERDIPIKWYRTFIDPKVLIELHKRSDLLGLLQSVGYLGTLCLTGGLAFYSTTHWSIAVTVFLVFLHGTCFAFQINAVHELGHGTVFQTRWLNRFFVHIFAFLGWIGHDMFNVSHTRHHQYTLHPPDDGEVVLPTRILLKQFFQTGFVNLMGPYGTVKNTLLIARGKFCGNWELRLFPEGDMEKRRPHMNWARFLLIGHGLIFVGSVLAAIFVHPKYLMLPVLISFGTSYGSWLFFSCNNTQHIGLQDNVPDFRLSCRTMILNPVAQFLYWHMNYHTEHHMYAAVPCYKLGKLHRTIEHDLPPCPVGIIATWKVIAAIQAKQKEDPKYQYVAPLPNAQES